jgi:hypothetical protein
MRFRHKRVDSETQAAFEGVTAVRRKIVLWTTVAKLHLAADMSGLYQFEAVLLHRDDECRIVKTALQVAELCRTRLSSRWC